MKKLVKIPQLISAEELQAGDIIIVSQNPRGSFLGKFIFAFQSLFNEEGGKNNTEHAAIIIQTDDGLKMAHLLGKGFVIEDITECKRTKQVYRIRNADDRARIGNALSRFIETSKSNLYRTVSWRYFVAFFGFFYHLFNSIGLNHTQLEDGKKPKLEAPEVSSHSVCTKFVMECMQIAADQVDPSERKLRQKYMNLYTSTSPKNLQSYLQCNPHYESFMMPHRMPEEASLYESLKTKLTEGLKGTKRDTMLNAIEQFEFQSIGEVGDSFTQTCYLVKFVSPHLKSHPKRFEIWHFLNSKGVYQEYVDQNTLEENDANTQLHLQPLRYTPVEQQHYDIYRGRGYSDAYAQFKVRPTLGTWFALNPRRITFFSIVLPVLGTLGALIFGAVVVSLIKRSNKAFAAKQALENVSPMAALGTGVDEVEPPVSPTQGAANGIFAQGEPAVARQASELSSNQSF